MEPLTIILAIFPFFAVLLCLLLFRMTAFVTSVVFFILTLIIEMFWFDDTTKIAAISVASSIFIGFPITLFIGATIFHGLFLERCGAVKCIASALGKFAGRDRPIQWVIINTGVAAILSAAGLNPVAILPLIMLSLGSSVYLAIALPAMGASVAWIFHTYGAPSEAFFLYLGGGQTFGQATMFLVKYLWLTTFVVVLAMFYLQLGVRGFRRGILPAILTALAAWVSAFFTNRFEAPRASGFAIGIAIIIVLGIYSRFGGKKDNEGPVSSRGGVAMPLHLALLPIVLAAALIYVTGFVSPIRDILEVHFSLPTSLEAAQDIKLRPLQQPYLLIFASVLLSAVFIPKGFSALKETGALWLARGVRPMLAALLFFGGVMLMWNSGRDITTSSDGYSAGVLREGSLNMVQCLLDFAASHLGVLYPIAATASGMRMGLLSGSAIFPVEVLTASHLEIAGEILKPGGAGSFIAASSAVAASLMVMVSPTWLMCASALTGKPEMGPRVLRSTFVTVFVLVLSLGIYALVLSNR